MQYRSRFHIFNSFGNALLFRDIYEGRLGKISANIKLIVKDRNIWYYIIKGLLH
jgi:hypothetical protein